MKFKIVGYLVLLSVLLFNCKKDDPSPGTIDVGTFNGNLIVADDPQTKAGYITNANVSVSINGSTATIKVTGEPGFDREYTGSVVSNMQGAYNITINKQTKPTEKNAGERLIIMNNNLTITLNVTNDNVTVRPEPNATATISISGKLQMIGSDLLKQ